MSEPHFDHVDPAFLQLSFAIKLWHYLDVHQIEKNEFDIPLTIEDPDNGSVCQKMSSIRTKTSSVPRRTIYQSASVLRPSRYGMQLASTVDYRAGS